MTIPKNYKIEVNQYLKTAILVVFTLFCNIFSADAGQAAASRAKWLWHPDGWQENMRCYFRMEFDLEKEPTGGVLNISGDDVYSVYINGVRIHTATNFTCPPFAAEKFLRKGRNVVALDVLNIKGIGGMILRADINTAGSSQPVEIVSDRKWRVSKEAAPGWEKTDFNDRGWRNASEIAGVTENHIWNGLIDIKKFLSPQEFAAYRGLNEDRIEFYRKNRQKIYATLQAEPAASKVQTVRKNGFPSIRIGDREFPLFLYNSVMLNMDSGKGSHLDRFKRFHDAGFRLFCINVPFAEIWSADGKVNTALVEERILNVLVAAPDARLLLFLDLNPPRWYVERCPNELIRYGSGAVPQFDGDHLATPMARPSMASKRWLADCGEVIRIVLGNLEKSPVGKRIFGALAVYGIYSEWHYFGMEKDLPDTGIAMTGRFREFLKNKYTSDQNLRWAWGDASVTIAAAAVPVRERLERKNGVLRAPAQEQRVLDYLECHSNVINECQKFFSAQIKKASGERILSGHYSGYFFGMHYPAEGWQVGTPEMITGNSVDFQVAPYAYFSRDSGGTGMPRHVMDSYPLNNKFAIVEADTRTHSSGDVHHGIAASFEETKAQMSRDFCNAVTRGAGLWYYDFDYGWYDRPEYLAFFSSLHKILENPPEVTRVSEVAFICDFDSVPYHTNSVSPNEFQWRLLTHTVQELYYAGAPFDTILWDDIDKKEYSVYIFPNSFHLTSKKRAAIEKLKQQGKTLVFLYAAGMIGENGFDSAEAESFTGMKIRLEHSASDMNLKILNNRHPFFSSLSGRAFPFGMNAGPSFVMDDPAAAVIGQYNAAGKCLPAFGMKKLGRSAVWYSAVPVLPRELLRGIYLASGIHIWNEKQQDVLFAARGVVGIHCAAGGKKTLILPGLARDITQLLPRRKQFPNGRKIEFIAPEKSTFLFKFEQIEKK